MPPRNRLPIEKKRVFDNLVRGLLKDRGMHQQDLAKALGISEGA